MTLQHDAPEQPTIPDVVPEPINGPETIVEEAPSSVPTEPPAAPEPQMALIPMTEDELREAGNALASLALQIRQQGR